MVVYEERRECTGVQCKHKERELKRERGEERHERKEVQARER